MKKFAMGIAALGVFAMLGGPVTAQPPYSAFVVNLPEEVECEVVDATGEVVFAGVIHNYNETHGGQSHVICRGEWLGDPPARAVRLDVVDCTNPGALTLQPTGYGTLACRLS